MVAASPAPWVMPMTSGLASGLRATLCTRVPAMPKAAPATAARTTRGNRRCSTTRSYGVPAPESERSTSTGATYGVPRERLTTMAASEHTTRTSATSAARRRTSRLTPPRRSSARSAGRATIPAGRPRSAPVLMRPPPVRRRTSTTSSGAPINAVTIPAGISPGGAISRPITSATSSRVGPSSAETASVQRWSAPTRARARCGTASPTKAIGPAAATRHRSAARRRRRRRAGPARSGARDRGRRRRRARARPGHGRPARPAAARRGRTARPGRPPLASRPASPPTTQKRYSSNVRVSTVSSAITTGGRGWRPGRRRPARG